ncbi:histidine phosphatase family protein [uncultured Friedmanniella sp.]|uniref:histidine phosphatase family protein n=1 Tax=uncultured Friedmanniella sp. TaxID=335381 RepID=UPI0035CA42BA
MSDEATSRQGFGTRTTVHLVRHGEVHNPAGLLYGRLPDYHLSDLGREMAVLVADDMAGRDIVNLVCSPLERAQETMAPLAGRLGLPVAIDERVIEAGNQLEGRKVTAGVILRTPRIWWLFRNAATPSWGEPYREIVARMRLALRDAAAAAAGHEAVVVSHQLPVWMARCDAEGRRLVHDPRKRECRLASVTSFTYTDGRLVSVGYREPAAALYAGPRPAKFVAGS